MCCCKLTSLVVIVYIGISAALEQYEDVAKLSLTISARSRQLEVSWKNVNIFPGDTILITSAQPLSFEKIHNRKEEAYTDRDNTTDYSDSKDEWTCNDGTCTILQTIIPTKSEDWIATTILYDYSLSKTVTINTTCYGFWVSFVNLNGTIVHTNCLSAHPMWMTKMRKKIENFPIRELFIPGTHDSGSYRPLFSLKNETLVTKYSLTQDEDITGQLMHGIRYLDIRVGYYRATKDQFWLNHGISRQRPLREIIEQVRDFVLETNEIVIFDVQEFPVGFGRTREIHRILVNYLKTAFDNILVDPSISWSSNLKEIWLRKQNVILCYDHISIVDEFPTILFSPVEQKWGNVQTLDDLLEFIEKNHQITLRRYDSHPLAVMAELTPDTWGVLTDKYGGLRKLADSVNRNVSRIFEDLIGLDTNIVAVDYFRGTTIVETALNYNLRK